MPAPILPDDFPTWKRSVDLRLQQIYTSLNTKPAFNRVENGPLVVGRSGNRTITLNPDGATNAEIWLDPDGSGANPTRITADSGGGGTANLEMTSGSSGGVSSSLTLAYNQVDMRSGGGSFAYWGSDEARFGYNDSSSGNWLRFGPNICRHNGAWDDFASLGSETGILPGSVTIGGSGTSTTISYPSTMASTMGPVCTIRSGAGAAMKWCITASSSSSYSLAWETSTSIAVYQWAFRH